MSAVIGLIFIQLSAGSVLQPCSTSGTQAWSKQLQQVLPDCDLVSTSPDRQLALRIDPRGRITATRRDGQKLDTTGLRIGPPAMLSWSPNSNAFFIDDGEGSGLASVFRLFRIVDSRVTEDSTIHRNVLQRFRTAMKCSQARHDQSVWGFGWSPDGNELFLFVQDGSHYPCGRLPGSSITCVVRVSDGALIQQLTETAAHRRFGALLPPETFHK
jgi:hypothetical protein